MRHQHQTGPLLTVEREHLLKHVGRGLLVQVAGRLVTQHTGRTVDQRARDRGATHVMLEVRADNAPARALYDRNGYDVVSTRRAYYQPGGVDALVMRKPLQEKGDERG